MTEPKFTKGPWRIDYARAKVDGASIADIKVGDIFVAMVIGGFADEEWKANVHLIAAAPDLYEALRGLIAPSGGVYGTEGKIAAARAALSKADGGGK